MCKAILTLVLSTLLAPPASGKTDPAALLRKAAAFGGQGGTYSVQAKVATYEADQKVAEHLFEVSHRGSDKTYIAFLDPADRGKSLLILGDVLWLHLPSLSRSIKVSGAQNLAGNASSLSVARIRFDEEYQSVTVRQESVNRVPCYVLELHARKTNATYTNITYIIRQEDEMPVKADFYLASGAFAQSITYDRYAPSSGGKHLLLEMTIYDQIKKQSKTQIEYTNYRFQAPPDSLFRQGSTTGDSHPGQP